MTATVTDKMLVALPLDVCAELGIKPGVRLDFRAKEGKLEAVKVSGADPAANSSLADIYTQERDAEEMIIQKGCSCEVPDDFPK